MIKRILAALIAAAILGFIFAVYQGYFHINGLAAGKYPIRGVDVSHYQGEIDWQMLAGQTIHFAYIKATEGSSHIDEQFASNIKEAQKTDLIISAYHFFSFDSPGASQAEHFITTVESFEMMMPPAVDVEFYGDKKENPPDPEQVAAELNDFLDLVEAACGKKPVIYATLEAWELYIRNRFDRYPLWIRDIWKKPSLKSQPEDNWTFWQYTNRGRLNGFSGEEPFIDLNVFYGTETQWQQFIAPSNQS